MEVKLKCNPRNEGIIQVKVPFQGQVRKSLGYPEPTASCCASPAGALQELLSPHFLHSHSRLRKDWILWRYFSEIFGRHWKWCGSGMQNGSLEATISHGILQHATSVLILLMNIAFP